MIIPLQTLITNWKNLLKRPCVAYASGLTLKRDFRSIMSDQEASASSSSNHTDGHRREKCLFCRIVDEKSQDLTTLIYKDDEIVAFPDIRPATKYHFLIVPRQHIKDCKVLTPSQIGLLDHLVEIGHKLVDERIQADNNGDQPVAEIPKLMGFHWPPFHSIGHLHLHVIAPSNSMGFISRTIFRPASWWFVTADYVRERLQKEAANTYSPTDPSKSVKPVC